MMMKSLRMLGNNPHQDQKNVIQLREDPQKKSQILKITILKILKLSQAIKIFQF